VCPSSPINPLLPSPILFPVIPSESSACPELGEGNLSAERTRVPPRRTSVAARYTRRVVMLSWSKHPPATPVRAADIRAA
jgi:hypothetical protein